MIFLRSTALFAMVSGIYAQSQYTSTGTAAVAQAAATALTLSPTSSVAGLTFDRFVQIWLENEDYNAAIKDSQYPVSSKTNVNHIADLTLSKSCLSRVARHLPHKLSCHHPSLSGKLIQQSWIPYSCLRDNSLTMWLPWVVAPSASPMTTYTIFPRAPRQLLIFSKTAVSAGVCIRRICLILALKRVIATKRLVQMTTCASTSESPNLNCAPAQESLTTLLKVP